MNTDIYDKFMTLPLKERLAIIQATKHEEQEQREQNLRQEAESHAVYLGKCYNFHIQPRNGMFRSCTKYAKIISPRADTQYNISALTFCITPLYWFEYQAHKAHFDGDYYLGEFELVDGIQIESFNACEIQKWAEITPMDYNTAMDAYIKKLQDMIFYADHYRYGGVMPEDDEWETQ